MEDSLFASLKSAVSSIINGKVGASYQVRRGDLSKEQTEELTLLIAELCNNMSGKSKFLAYDVYKGLVQGKTELIAAVDCLENIGLRGSAAGVSDEGQQKDYSRNESDTGKSAKPSSVENSAQNVQEESKAPISPQVLLKIRDFIRNTGLKYDFDVENRRVAIHILQQSDYALFEKCRKDVYQLLVSNKFSMEVVDDCKNKASRQSQAN